MREDASNNRLANLLGTGFFRLEPGNGVYCEDDGNIRLANLNLLGTGLFRLEPGYGEPRHRVGPAWAE